MQIRLLVIQRKEPYPGAYLPEILSVVDEVTLEENSEWWDNEIDRQLDQIGTGEIDSWTTLTAEIPDDQIEKALYPSVDLTVKDSHDPSD